jgi:hypothetical protein
VARVRVEKKFIRSFVEVTWRKIPLGSLARRWMDNIKVDR